MKSPEGVEKLVVSQPTLPWEDAGDAEDQAMRKWIACVGRQEPTHPQSGARNKACWTCGQVGHFSANCNLRKCSQCGKPGHDKRRCFVRVKDLGDKFLLPAPVWAEIGDEERLRWPLCSLRREISLKGEDKEQSIKDTGASVSLIRTGAYN